MKVTKKITLKRNTMATASEVLKNNLFALQDDSWMYADDNGQPVMNVTYKIEENDVVFDVWMIDAQMQILFDKIMDEIQRG